MKNFGPKFFDNVFSTISFYFHNFFFSNFSTVISLQFREKGNKSTIIIVLKTFRTFKFPTQKGNSSLQTIALQFSLFSSCGEEQYSSLALVKNSKVTYLLSSCLWFYIQGSLVKPIWRSVAEESLFVACLQKIIYIYIHKHTYIYVLFCFFKIAEGLQVEIRYSKLIYTFSNNSQ